MRHPVKVATEEELLAVMAQYRIRRPTDAAGWAHVASTLNSMLPRQQPDRPSSSLPLKLQNDDDDWFTQT